LPATDESRPCNPCLGVPVGLLCLRLPTPVLPCHDRDEVVAAGGHLRDRSGLEPARPKRDWPLGGPLLLRGQKGLIVQLEQER